MSPVKFSRQYRYQQRKKKQGRCITCGDKAFTKTHCLDHAKKQVIANKKWKKMVGLTKENRKPLNQYTPRES